jgi:hypothetical protein
MNALDRLVQEEAKEQRRIRREMDIVIAAVQGLCGGVLITLLLTQSMPEWCAWVALFGIGLCYLGIYCFLRAVRDEER